MAALSSKELARRMEVDPPLLVDLRRAESFAAGTLPGARRVSVADVSELAEALVRVVDKRRRLVLLCDWGHRSAMACIALKRAGFREVAYLEGGIEAWVAEGLALVGGATPGTEPDRRTAAAGL